MNETVLALLDAFRYLAPEAELVLAACLLFLGATFRPNRHRWGAFALLALLVAAVTLAMGPQASPTQGAAVFAAPLRLDLLAILVKWIALVAGAVFVLFSWNEVPDRWAGEYHACLLVIVAGVCLTGSANELIVLFLALEMISIPTYILLYLPRYDTASQEAAMKYFLLSVFSSALLLFGFSYLYGMGGTTNLPALAQAFLTAGAGNLPALAQVALVLVVAGLSFRITAVPFHFYAPDVYQGAPTAGAALLAFVPKVAGFAALLRILGYVLPSAALVRADARMGPEGLALGLQAPMLLWILAAVTMTLGNVLALLQDNVRRMLAYSSVAHAGYMLMGLAAAPHLKGASGGADAVLFYLVAYGAMTVGAFAMIAYLDMPTRPVYQVDDLGGLGKSHPGLALLMALFLFSLIGIPLTAGFVGKLLLFVGAVGAATDSPGNQATLFQVLALIGALNAAVGGWYYLRIIAVMYLRNPLRPLEPVRRLPGLAALGVCAALTLFFGVYPKPLVDLTRHATARPLPEVVGASDQP